MTEGPIDPGSPARATSLLKQKHGRWLRDEQLTLQAQAHEHVVVATLKLTKNDHSSQYVMEAAVTVDDKMVCSEDAALNLGVDFLDWCLGAYFKDQREVLLPMDWQPHRFGEFEILARGDLTNPGLDDMADAWLRGDRPDVTAD